MATHPACAEATAQAMERFAGEVVRSSPLQDSGASARAACSNHTLHPAGCSGWADSALHAPCMHCRAPDGN